MTKTQITRESLEVVEFHGRAPRLTALAQFINENLPGYEAKIEHWSGSFDRHIPGTRLRHPGKYREGNVLRIYQKASKEPWQPVLNHNPQEAYRENNDVVRWILDRMREADRAGVQIKPFGHPDYQVNESKLEPGELPCCICGKTVTRTSETAMIHIGAGGSKFIAPDAQEPAESDLGFYPIGSTCLKRYPELQPLVILEKDMK